jgi:HSP20 family protein
METATETRKSEGKKDVMATKERTPNIFPLRSLDSFDQMYRLFDRLYEDIVPRGWLRPMHWARPAWSEAMAPFEGKMPSVDVIDRDEEVLVRAELPGVEKKDLEVTTTDGSVTIKGSTRREEKEEKGDYYRCEISRGAFARSISLPASVDGSRAKAMFKDGVLELTLPKVEKARRQSVKID